MCRYATAYKPHYACFACRKAFKRRRAGDLPSHLPDRPYRCPQCAGPMADMGLDFAPPKQRDARAWQVLAALWTSGHTFHSCGCEGPGYRPRDPVALRAFLEARRDQYRALAAEPGRDRGPGVPETTATGTPRWRRRTEAEAQVWWRERLRRVETALSEL